ncbi:hypothetical protein GCM10025865_28980 [Paraoerskovia sediminicola]|uniref:ScoMcrA-like N-terminal head domain-containing protein n=1 Tax=Paraoerskovia sediminicola TaxID=1138587 RepID=A0ABM8G647_9CELL|nr:hypothetical protein [Paraoerskovia sediminicola]BDZ43599.1 hypothetical protein GCM10025865_28980 [Paraoerskovia sediminicola]
MATFSSVTPSHILQAIAECDRRGGDTFLKLYGFAPTAGYAVVHEGRSYDTKAILGVAHRYATGRLAPPDEFSGGADGAAKILRKRGFEVTTPPGATAGPRRPARASSARGSAARGASARSTAAPARRAAAPERPVDLCPTCFMALPATGVCDDCG